MPPIVTNNAYKFLSTKHVANIKITASQWTMSGQDDHLLGQTFSWPVILTGQVNGFQNKMKNKFIHINSGNYENRYRYIIKYFSCLQMRKLPSVAF